MRVVYNDEYINLNIDKEKVISLKHFKNSLYNNKTKYFLL